MSIVNFGNLLATTASGVSSVPVSFLLWGLPLHYAAPIVAGPQLLDICPGFRLFILFFVFAFSVWEVFNNMSSSSLILSSAMPSMKGPSKVSFIRYRAFESQLFLLILP